MLQRINLLSPQLASQIAAGEVVERPSSVVKELVENSIDAGATEITVTIEQGGAKKIVVHDNGVGIHHDDLVFALSRHATSKIRSSADLAAIHSLGFRGEALASISAVSRLTLTTRTQGSDLAWQVYCPGDPDAVTIQPAAHPIGTTVEVADLFFNVPARKKFLKSGATEFLRIEELLQRIALSRFDLAFTLTHNAKKILYLPRAIEAEQQKERVIKICGPEFMEQALKLDAKTATMRVYGWAASPNYSRSQGDLQYFYVNGRLVKDKLLASAVKHAYADHLYHGRFPALVLFFEIDPLLVDVNVHPAKAEVRFREGAGVYEFLVRAIKQSLAPLQVPKQEAMRREAIPDFTPLIDFHDQRQQSSLLSFGSATTVGSDSLAPTTNTQAFKSHVTFHPLGYAVGMLHGLYLIAQNEAGVVLVDVHAAYERIAYEKLKKQLAANATPPAQRLLLPISVTLLPADLVGLSQEEGLLERLGFEIEKMGENIIVVRSVPTLLCNYNISNLIKDLSSELNAQGSSIDVSQKEQKILATLACHNSIRGKNTLSMLEMNALLREMEQTDFINQCNHGRPTWVQLTLAELDKIFMRGR